MQCEIHLLQIKSPSDTDSLQKSFKSGEIIPNDIVAILGKTEGNGCVNDFTRGYMIDSLKNLIGKYVDDSKLKSISFIMSGGTEGILTPHLTVITKRNVNTEAQLLKSVKSLAVGVAKTREILPEELGRAAHIEMVKSATLLAMKDAGIQKASDVHFVQIKCPLLTSSDFDGTSHETITNETYKSMAYSRGASSLGVGLALEEEGFDSADCLEKLNCKDFSRYSTVASASAGAELKYCEVIVLGNSYQSTSDFFIIHDVMLDALDKQSFTRAKETLNGSLCSPFEVIQVLAKAEANPSGKLRGLRTTMLDDSDINHTRHARAAVGAVLAAEIGSSMIYVSGGAEHQGPAGGGPIALICKRKLNISK